MKIIELIKTTQDNLKAAGLEENVAFKLLYAIHPTIHDLMSFHEHKDETLNLYQQLKYTIYLYQYIVKQKPLAYILKQAFFFHHTFSVFNQVHIPKVESETMIEVALDLFKNKKEINVLDLCCGTGVLGLSLAKEIPIHLTLVDCAKKAIKNTKRNAYELQVPCTIIKSNLFTNVHDSFDLILCNPPYVDKHDTRLEESVKKYEPHQALFASNNGLFFYQEILKNAAEFLKPNGIILFEVGYNQAQQVKALAQANKMVKKVAIKQDAFQHERIVIVYF